jgi:hypothetical protein
VGAFRSISDRLIHTKRLEGVEEFLASVRAALKEPSFETKQKVLRLVVDRIVVEDSKVIVHHVVPTGPVHLQTERQLVNRGNCTPREGKRGFFTNQIVDGKHQPFDSL